MPSNDSQSPGKASPSTVGTHPGGQVTTTSTPPSTQVQPTTSTSRPIASTTTTAAATTTSTTSVPAHTSTTPTTAPATSASPSTVASSTAPIPPASSGTPTSPAPSTSPSTSPSNSPPGNPGGSVSTTAGENSSPSPASPTQVAPVGASSSGLWTGPLSAIPSTWLTVYGATPTTETFSMPTTVDGSTFETTMVVTTSHGGITSTATGLPEPTSGGGSRNSNPTPNAGPSHAAKIGGAVVGAIVGAVIVVLVALFLCRVLHRRRIIVNRERQMTEGWLSGSLRSGSRATNPRSEHEDADSGSHKMSVRSNTSAERENLSAGRETFAINTTATLERDDRDDPEMLMSPMAFARPPSAMERSFSSSFKDSPPKGKKKSVTIGSIGSPVGPVRVAGDGNGEAMRSTISLQDAQAQERYRGPFLDGASPGGTGGYGADAMASTGAFPSEISPLQWKDPYAL